MSLTLAESLILESIVVHSENDPNNPEFPHDKPKFPATVTYPIPIPGFTNVWLKDESSNPTGTHKDRMAWEIIVYYRDFLFAKQRNQTNLPLPAMSIISSGSAATAIQYLLTKFNLPNLKVLLDHTTEQAMMQQLADTGCELYLTDLSEKALNTRDILSLTDNPNGFDITSCHGLNATTQFYDWLSYEIINNFPEYCFIPYGTGHLFTNILNIARKELTSVHHDKRFMGDSYLLRNCHYFAATTDNPNSKAEKLYAPHNPFNHTDEQWLRFYKQAGYCGALTNIHQVKEYYIDQAVELAKDLAINCEPSGIAGLGLLLQLQKKLDKHKKIVIVNTGKVMTHT